MLFFIETNLNHFIFVRKTIHNLTFLKNLSSRIINPKKVKVDKNLCKNDKIESETINNMNENPTAIFISGDSDDRSPDISIMDVRSVSVEPGTSQSQISKKESTDSDKQSVYVENSNFVYRHSRYSSRCTTSLQNIYLRRNDPEEKPIKRHFSTDDVDFKQEQLDVNLTSNFRKWIITSYGKELMNSEKVNHNGKVFTLMNYNVLAQDLLVEHAYIYKQHTPRALLWEIRWKNLYEEITGHMADIICLQEVQESHIGHYYDNIQKLGYGQLFKRKTGNRTDGCAIFYKKDVFTLVDYIFVEYFQSGTTVLDRENVAIVTTFAPVDNPSYHFVVATTHLLYNPRRQDVRLAQTQVLLTEVERMAFKGINNAGLPTYYPMIICGDFNSEPDSKVVQFILNSYLKYDILAKRTLNMFELSENQLKNSKYSQAITGRELIPPKVGITDHCQHFGLLSTRYHNCSTLPRSKQEELLNLEHSGRRYNPLRSPYNQSLFSTGTLHHNFILKDAFFSVEKNLTGTTYQDAWITVDYIFYSTEHVNKKDGILKVISKYSVPTVEQLKMVKTIPNFVVGSDHLALLTKFMLDYNEYD